jgi:hypothetical protein
MGVTVILNGFKRPHALKEQYNAIKAQTYKNIDIMLWSNYDQGAFDQYPEDVVQNCAAAFCNHNLGVWARFAFALNAFTKYICIIDDDTIPGSQWIENCLNTMQTNRGLLGCRGVRMTGDDCRNYPGCSYEGISGGNNEIQQVDIMGHCWFFERDWLRAYWAEAPSSPLRYGGEDMHFSYVLQKYYGLNTYVPPQPENNQEMWGSTNPSKYGEDMAATSRTTVGHSQSNAYWNFILSQGYKLVKDM